MCAHITKRDDCRMRLILTWLICWNGEHHENDDQISEYNEDYWKGETPYLPPALLYLGCIFRELTLNIWKSRLTRWSEMKQD